MLSNDELVRRYRAGDPLAALAADAEMSLGGLQRRLRRLGVPPRRAARTAGRDQIEAALRSHGTVSAAARALGVPRNLVTAEAQRLGLRPRPDIPGDLADRYARERSLDALAAHYQVSGPTISRWLHVLGITPQPAGRRPRDEG